MDDKQNIMHVRLQWKRQHLFFFTTFSLEKKFEDTGNRKP